MFFSLRIQSLFSHLHDSLLVYSRVSFFLVFSYRAVLNPGKKLRLLPGERKQIGKIQPVTVMWRRVKTEESIQSGDGGRERERDVCGEN